MATCPLGFGSAGAGKAELSQYHCVLCRGLLHKPVKVDSCRHVFCAFCIGRFRDCPVCGADINNTSPDDDLSTAISKILLGHAKLVSKTSRTSCPVASGQASTAATSSCPVASTPSTNPATCPAGGDASSADLDLPSLLLQLALQSLSGGNPEAALARLDMCADALCSQAGVTNTPTDQAPSRPQPVTEPQQPNPAPTPSAPTSTPDSPTNPDAPTSSALPHHMAASATHPDTASRLGAVLGCQADCHRRLGDPGAAQRCYAASLACMAPWRGRSREVDSALSVTHNKLGDLMLVAGDVGQAREHYERALEIRREVLGGGVGKQCRASGSGDEVEVVQDVCDLATSMCKVADVWMTLREGAQGTREERPEDGSGGAEQERGQVQEQGGEQPEVLLAEARQVMLRQEVLPYARACGLGPVAETKAETKVAAGEEGSGGGLEAEKGKEKGAGSEGAGLAPVLVQRYGRVWGAIEQLTVRLKEIQVA